MNASQPRSRGAHPQQRTDYVWQYEYYDDEEPVSFEGLKAHRYSIVIGFWVGLAVFVIFMFFVLTLLTKTGAPPHQENMEPLEKRRRPGVRLPDVPPPDDPEKAFSRPLLGEPGGDARGDRAGARGGGGNRGRPDGRGFGGVGSAAIERMANEGEEENDAAAGLWPIGGGGGAPRETASEGAEDVLMSHFDIPNFVNSESPSSSSLGDNTLLICESTLPPARRSRSLEAHSSIA